MFGGIFHLHYYTLLYLYLSLSLSMRLCSFSPFQPHPFDLPAFRRPGWKSPDSITSSSFQGGWCDANMKETAELCCGIARLRNRSMCGPSSAMPICWCVCTVRWWRKSLPFFLIISAAVCSFGQLLGSTEQRIDALRAASSAVNIFQKESVTLHRLLRLCHANAAHRRWTRHRQEPTTPQKM